MSQLHLDVGEEIVVADGPGLISAEDGIWDVVLPIDPTGTLPLICARQRKKRSNLLAAVPHPAASRVKVCIKKIENNDAN